MNGHDYFATITIDEDCMTTWLPVYDKAGTLKSTDELPPVDVTGEPSTHAVTRTSSTLAWSSGIGRPRARRDSI